MPLVTDLIHIPERVHLGDFVPDATRRTGSRGVDVAPRGDISEDASLAHQPGLGEDRRQCASGDRVPVVNRFRKNVDVASASCVPRAKCRRGEWDGVWLGLLASDGQMIGVVGVF